MEGFTVALALVDAIPVLCFGAGMILIAARFNSPLFIIGAALSTLAGCCKVIWKLILGIRKKDVRLLNKSFVPLQATGFALILVSLVLGFRRIAWDSLWRGVSGFPAVIFFAVWLCMMGCMIWYRKCRFDNSAKANWTAQIINCIGQCSLLIGVLLAG